MIATALATVLFLLAALHVYWALGGRRGFSAAIPQTESGGPPAFLPGPALTFAVVGVLAAGGLIALALGGVVQLEDLPRSWARGLGAFGAFAFAGRAIGDFRLVGFFKRVRGTTFARWDSRLHSPLCVAISAAWLALVLRA